MPDPRPLRAGRPRKIRGTPSRWWLYVSAESRAAAEKRATAEGVDLPDVVRAFVDGYADGHVNAPTPAPLEA